MAQLNAVGAFGQNGETVSLECPNELPTFTNCSFTPCPITPTVGGNVPFSVVIVTSSSTVQAPEIPNPCMSSSGNMAAGTRGPSGILRVWRNAPNQVPLYPALLAILAALGLLGLGAMRARPDYGRAARNARIIFALAVISGAFLVACGGGGNASTKPMPTPVATTTMNVPASAIDSSGNPMNAGRGLQIILDVINK
jgi:hypothetical protein